MDDSRNPEHNIDIDGDVIGANINIGGTQIYHGDFNVYHGTAPTQPPAPKPIRVFLSYARADDEPFVKRLYEYLTAHGFAVWWDREKMSRRGLSFLPEIRDAVAGSDRLALVIGPGAIKSDYVRAEWEYALSACIPVTPLLRLTDGSDKPYVIIPAALGGLHCPDCREARPEAEAFAEIARVLHEPAPPLGALHGVPPLPEWYITRTADLTSLRDSVCADSAAPVVITSKRHTVALRGIAGIGKSTQISALAHECDIQRTFPDGVIWLEFGKAPSVVARLADVGAIYGDARDNYPDVTSGQIRLGQLLQHRRVLIILDDVWERQHAEPFRVVSARCRVVITTRKSQIAALLGAINCALDVLSDDEGAALIRKRLELEVDADADYPHKATHRQIVETLGGHTLAISIAAARLAEKGADYAPKLLERLEKQRDGKTPFKDLMMSKDDRQFDLEASLSLSYAELSDDLKRRFRALGAFAAEGTFGIAMAARLWEDDDPDDAEDALDELVHAALLNDEGNGRYAQHNLLRGYSLALAQRENEEEALHTLHFAVYRAAHGDYNTNNNERRHPAIRQDFENIQHALTWGLLHEPEKACDWTTAFDYYLQFHVPNSVRQDMLQTAYTVADRIDYTRGQANTLRALGDVSVRRDALSEARVYYDRALTLFEALEDWLGQARTLHALGVVSASRDALSEARAYYDRALTLYEALKDRLGQANTLHALGELSVQRDALSEARAYYDRALTLYEAVEDRLGQANALHALGELSVRRAALSEARTCYDRALMLYEALEDRRGQAHTLRALGELSVRHDALSEARAHYDRALTLYEEIEDRRGQATTLRALGELSVRRAALSEARAYYDRALMLYEALEERLGQANTLRALGNLSVRRAALSEARAYYDRALTLYEALEDQLGQANTLRALGELSVRRAALSEARAYYDRALMLFEAREDQLGQANTLRALGNLSVRRDALSEARAYYDRALTLFDALEERRGQATTLRSLGELSVQRAALSEARAYYDRALTLFDVLEDQLGQANTLRLLGQLSVRRDALSEARVYYDHALTLFDALEDQHGQATTLQALGDLSCQQKQYDVAESYYAQALALYHAVGDRIGLMNILMSQARMAYTRGQLDTAIHLFSQVLEIVDDMPDYRDRPILVGIRRELVVVLDKAGRHDEAQALRAQLPAEQSTPSTLPQDTINTLAGNTVAVKTDENEQLGEWCTALQGLRDSSATRGDDGLSEVAFVDALLAVLNDQPVALPDGNPYQSAVQQVIANIAEYHKGA